jgi:hypothetical protein
MQVASVFTAGWDHRNDHDRDNHRRWQPRHHRHGHWRNWCDRDRRWHRDWCWDD